MTTILLIFIQKSITQGIGILYGSIGEILTEKSGKLNLGIPGLMYIGGVSGLIGAYYYELNATHPIPIVGLVISLLCSIVFTGLGASIYAYLTISLRTNQNVVGLALTTFGIGFGNFFGGSLSKLAGGVGQISVATTAQVYKTQIPLLSKIPVLGSLLFSYGFLTYLAILLAFALSWFLQRTKVGLQLRAIGENPSAADAAGIDIQKYTYIATIVGGIIAGFGGLFFVMDYLGGTWTNNGFGDRGWLAIALVIFSLWDTKKAIAGSFLFGALYILYLYIPNLSRSTQELFKMSQYLVTIIVLVITSMQKKQEYQPPESLGIPYFREDR
ncbi:MAG: ABC transporter permease [Treponema sp.]|nr:ABC transporter permease [Treponema sp.]